MSNKIHIKFVFEKGSPTNVNISKYHINLKTILIDLYILSS